MTARAFALLLVASALLAAHTASASTQKGDMELGLAGSFRTAQDTGSPITEQQNTAGAAIGYFVTDVLELGYALVLFSATTTDEQDNQLSRTRISFHNLFLDYYVYLDAEDTAALYFGPSLGVARLTSDTDLVQVEGRGGTFALHLGLKYFVSEDTSLFANMEGRSSSLELTVTTPFGSAEVSGSRSEGTLFLGMTYFFGIGGG